MDAPRYRASRRRCAVESLQKSLAIGLLLALTSLPTPSSAGQHSESAPTVTRSNGLVEISGGKIGFRQVGRQDAGHRNQNSQGSTPSSTDTGGTVLAQGGGPVTSTDHDVVIVGAGAAGLYAAVVLDGLGYDVLVVEASDRHGGRVWSDTMGDIGIELGAEELYGTNNNFIFNDIKAMYGNGAQIEIFRENNSQDTLISMDGGNTCWVVTGNCQDDPDIYDYWDFYYDYGSHANDPTDITVAEHMDTVLGVDSSHRAYHLYEVLTPAGEYGTTVERLGLRSLSRQGALWTLSSKVYGLAPTGYLDALNALYFDPILGKVTLNSPVTKIDTSGVKPVAIDANDVYHYADAIIVTVSLGVLQAGLIEFVPALPVAKQNAIDTLGMGKGMKISLRFTSQFWEDKMMDAITEGPTAECWAPKKYQPGAVDHVLTCFIMGINGEIMSALPDDTARINQALSDLDEMFSNAATPAYMSAVVQDWSNEPYVLGSYSYPTVGSFPGGTSMREVLAQPVGTTLFFAGEATNNGNSATVPGAMHTGERAAGEHHTAIGGPPAPGTPTADFSALVTSGPAPLDVSFTDLSNQLPTGWSWNFGDSGSSSVQHPNHLYTTPGDYTVSLTATNPNGSHTRVMPLMISVPEPSVSATLVSGVFMLMLMQSRRRQLATRRR
ncbi:MAG: FAD-dependent oxidoreductase [Myxococcales bacterium]|nr:FAD-dependent oxidoreductase [Myxococcales bacterium]